MRLPWDQLTLLRLRYVSASYTSLVRPKSDIFRTLPLPTKTFLAARSRWTSWKGKKQHQIQNTPLFQVFEVFITSFWLVNQRLIGLNIFSFKSIPYNGVSWFEMHRFSLIIIQENQLQEAALFVTLISLRYCIPFEICQANDNRSLMLRSSGSVEFPLSDCDLKYRLQRWLM